MFPGVATEAEALDAEAFKIAVASTVHLEVITPLWLGPLVAELAPLRISMDRLSDSVGILRADVSAIRTDVMSTKQVAAKTYNASCADGSRIPYTIVPFTDGTNPLPELPEIRNYNNILALSEDHTVAYLQGYGGHHLAEPTIDGNR